MDGLTDIGIWIFAVMVGWSISAAARRYAHRTEKEKPKRDTYYLEDESR